MKLFLKSIVVGIGGIAPGLSGSVLMIIFGMYRQTLEALGTLFVDFKKKFCYLVPVGAGIVVGLLFFSNILNFFLGRFEMPTRFAFLGLIVGTIPLFYRELTKEGFSKWYIPVILASFIAGMFLFTLNRDPFPQITDPNLWQKFGLGVAVVATAIVPGADSVVLLSTFGLYELYLSVLSNPWTNLHIILPMLAGAVTGGIAISFLMTQLFRRWYTATFSVIFGIFLSMIPNMLNESCQPGLDWKTAISLLLMVGGFCLSLFLGRMGQKKTA